MLNNPADDVSLERILNVPPRGIGQRSVDELTRWARTLGVPMRRALDILADDPEVETPIPRAGKASLARLGAVFKELQQAVNELEAADLLDLVLERIGYRDYLFSDDEQGEDRWDNVRELRTVAADFAGVPPPDGLAAFLEQVALVSDADNADTGDGVTLITLHQAKGLEFPAMFMVGMEEGMLPHIRSFDDPGEMEEERRLCYVGMTRAKERLYMTRAFRRRVMGNSLPGIPSRFLGDIPRELIASPEGEREGRQETSGVADRQPRPRRPVRPEGNRRARRRRGPRPTALRAGRPRDAREVRRGRGRQLQSRPGRLRADRRLRRQRRQTPPPLPSQTGIQPVGATLVVARPINSGGGEPAPVA